MRVRYVAVHRGLESTPRTAPVWKCSLGQGHGASRQWLESRRLEHSRNAKRSPRASRRKSERRRDRGRESEEQREKFLLGNWRLRKPLGTSYAVANSNVIDEPTLRHGHGYGNALAGCYGIFSSTSSSESWLRNGALWEETRWYASPGYESKTRHTTLTIESDKQLTLWGSTVSSSRPRPFEVLVRAVRCYLRLKKDFKQIVSFMDPSFWSPSVYDPVPVGPGPETELCSKANFVWERFANVKVAGFKRRG